MADYIHAILWIVCTLFAAFVLSFVIRWTEFIVYMTLDAMANANIWPYNRKEK